MNDCYRKLYFDEFFEEIGKSRYISSERIEVETRSESNNTLINTGNYNVVSEYVITTNLNRILSENTKIKAIKETYIGKYKTKFFHLCTILEEKSINANVFDSIVAQVSLGSVDCYICSPSFNVRRIDSIDTDYLICGDFGDLIGVRSNIDYVTRIISNKKPIFVFAPLDGLYRNTLRRVKKKNKEAKKPRLSFDYDIDYSVIEINLGRNVCLIDRAIFTRRPSYIKNYHTNECYKIESLERCLVVCTSFIPIQSLNTKSLEFIRESTEGYFVFMKKEVEEDKDEQRSI